MNPNEIGREVISDIPPISAGPKKFPANEINATRAIPTDGATPGTLMAAKLNAGKKGPMHNPTIAKARDKIPTPKNLFVVASGIPTTKPMAKEIPPI